MRTSSGWILALCVLVGGAAGWFWGASEVAGISAGLRARGEVGDQYPIIAPAALVFGLLAGALVGFAIIGIARVLRPIWIAEMVRRQESGESRR